LLLASFFEVKQNEILEETHLIATCPAHIFTGSPRNFKLSSSDTLRIILRPDDTILTDPNIGSFEFQQYKIDGKPWLLSKEIKDLITLLKDPKFLLSNRILCLLKVSHSEQVEYSFNFSQEYRGWYHIVFPFICFVESVAKLPAPVVTSRILHLPQSSGYGKTRLCFEVLKYENCGIYCVFRSNKEGYPGTTSWMSLLMVKFRESKSDEEAILLCMDFIKESIKNFSNFGEPERAKKILALFEGQTEYAISTSFDLNSKSTDSIENEIKNILDESGRKVFPIIFDECHELLVLPHNSSSTGGGPRISLYRALRRALTKLKHFKIVAVFLGTKSSLDDFVLNSRRDPSTRLAGDDSEREVCIPPYIYTTGVDVMLDKPFLVSYEELNQYKRVYDDIVFYPKVLKDISVRCGRALWSTYKSYKAAFDLARTKLKTELSLFELTCFLLRIGSSVSPQDPLAHKLVLSGMATLIQVDLDGSRCLIEYVPEPLLANVARTCMCDHEFYAKAIKEYLKRLELGTFHDSGTSGELVGRIVILRAMDLALLKFTTSYKVSTFEPFEKYAMSVFESYITDTPKDDVSAFKTRLEAVKDSIKLKIDTNTSGSNSQESSGSSGQENLGSNAKKSKDSAESDENTSNSKILVPYLGMTTLKAFLIMLTGLNDEDLKLFGVSESVLNGFVTVSQFIQMENPLENVNQIFLMHGFSRSCGFILPPRAPGADLLIPVLRTDNMMSCVAVQIKNYNYKVKFPHTPGKTTSKLTFEYLNYLDFSAIGDFNEAPKDDFVRIVIQFTERLNNTDEEDPSDIMTDWRKIKDNTQALWINGLASFSKPLFFNNQGIINDLYRLLSGQRDFLNGLDFPDVVLPAKVQTTKDGARFSARSARPLASSSALISQDSQMRKAFPKQYNKFKMQSRHLDLLDFSKEYQRYFTFTPKGSEIPEESDMDKGKRFEIEADKVLEKHLSRASAYSSKSSHIDNLKLEREKQQKEEEEEMEKEKEREKQQKEREKQQKRQKQQKQQKELDEEVYDEKAIDLGANQIQEEEKDFKLLIQPEASSTSSRPKRPFSSTYKTGSVIKKRK
jgi:hypothetical protein